MHIITINGIRAYLANPVLSQNIHIYETLNSTNEEARKLEQGSIIIALSQTSGRGRHGKSFHSPSGGIYMSLVLNNCQLSTVNRQLTTPAAAVTVCNVIETVTGNSCKIKWVNDIFLNNKKICGILTEAVSGAVILGIGINVTANEEYAGIFNSDIPENTHNRLIAGIINSITSDTWLENVIPEYKKRCFILGKQVKYGETTAIAVDINEFGNLITEKPDGTRDVLSSGEVSVTL
ncbi:MAG: biotin--[acetyl-CoA-carboxylase] ligase [Oscillospiraceae bacterium]|nr:biotin--[acetyl-CoA-carboxylase] ligase [Oscillospiraceae bacterium]